eukprot:1439376-Pleurochrysis_carterae.AAC.4
MGAGAGRACAVASMREQRASDVGHARAVTKKPGERSASAPQVRMRCEQNGKQCMRAMKWGD